MVPSEVPFSKLRVSFEGFGVESRGLCRTSSDIQHLNPTPKFSTRHPPYPALSPKLEEQSPEAETRNHPLAKRIFACYLGVSEKIRVFEGPSIKDLTI